MKSIFYKIISPFRTAYWFIFRPKTTGVKCLIEHDGKFLMIRNTYGQKHWTFPGGGVKRGEMPENAARREAYEEVGINLEALIPMGEYFSTRQYKQDTVYCFYGKTKDEYFKVDGGEVLEAKWFAVSNIPATQAAAVGTVLNLYADCFKVINKL